MCVCVCVCVIIFFFYTGTEALAKEYEQAKTTLESNDTYIQVHIHSLYTLYLQWNLRIMDTLGTSILSIVRRLSLGRR